MSVIIPTLNEEVRLGRLLASLARIAPAEIIVADGGSADRTVEIAAGSGARVLSAPRGRGAQLHAGAAASQGEVLWFLHADVIPPDDALRHIGRALGDPAVVGGAFRVRTVDDGGLRWGPVLRLADLRSHVTRLPYGDQGLFVRREVYERSGGFPRVPLMEDIALSLALSRLGRLVTVPADLTVSGRRWGHRPVFYTAAMWIFPWLWRLGVPEDRLAAWYRDVR